jgi:AcrR family transcriptional regulator
MAHSPFKVRKQPQHSRSRHTVDMISKATECLLLERGWSGTSTNRIAERAGVSIGSLYQYFPNKRAVVATLADRKMELVETELHNTITDLADLPASEFLERLCQQVVRTYQRDTQVLMLMEELATRLGQNERRLEERMRLVERLEKHFLDHADQLTVRNPRRAVMAAIAGADAMIHDAGRSSPRALSQSELAEDMTAFTSSCLGLCTKR